MTRKDTKLAQKANKCKKECKELPVQKNRNQKRQQCPENQEEQRAQESQKQRTSKKHKLQAERKERDPTKCQKSCNHPKNFQLSSSGFFVDKTLRFLQAIAAEVAHPLCRPNELVAQLLQRKQNESICEFLVVTDLRFCIVSRQNRLAKELGK